MSVVIALKDENGVCWLACDRQITYGSTKKIFGDDQNKVFDVKERPGYLIGSVGFLRGINLLEANNCYIDELAYYRKSIDYDYMVNVFVPSVAALYHEAGFTDVEAKTLDLKNELLVVANDNIYEVGGDGSIMVIDNYSAIGSGSELAMGSLATTDGAEPKERLTLALEAAHSNIYCGGGGVIINNKNDEIYQIEF